jgi:branched-chain amino acid transport system ATP-binding protein
MLELLDVHAHYGESHILQGVSLEVQGGQVAALLGRNGVGKTTTLRAVMGLTAPSRGAVLFNGRDVVGLRPHQIARMGIGLVPQGRHVFPALTVRETLTLASASCRRRGSGHKGIERILDQFPLLRGLAERRGNQLSGGQQQVLAIARALAMHPDLLLMDEPTEGLAPVMAANIADIVAQLKQRGLSILLVEQHLRFALRVAGYVYVMVKGSIKHNSTPEELAANQYVKTQYLGIPTAS